MDSILCTRTPLGPTVKHGRTQYRLSSYRHPVAQPVGSRWSEADADESARKRHLQSIRERRRRGTGFPLRQSGGRQCPLRATAAETQDPDPQCCASLIDPSLASGAFLSERPLIMLPTDRGISDHSAPAQHLWSRPGYSQSSHVAWCVLERTRRGELQADDTP